MISHSDRKEWQELRMIRHVILFQNQKLKERPRLVKWGAWSIRTEFCMIWNWGCPFAPSCEKPFLEVLENVRVLPTLWDPEVLMLCCLEPEENSVNHQSHLQPADTGKLLTTWVRDGQTHCIHPDFQVQTAQCSTLLTPSPSPFFWFTSQTLL